MTKLESLFLSFLKKGVKIYDENSDMEVIGKKQARLIKWVCRKLRVRLFEGDV